MTATEGMSSAIPSLTPENFWSFYKTEIQEAGSWRAYQEDGSWTPIAISAAESVCRKFGFQTCREYLRLDVLAWTGSWTDTDYDWDLRVAFKNENGPSWEDELCKLAHIVSDLRVLVAYQLWVGQRTKEDLEKYLIRHRRRVVRDCNCKWLFIWPDPHGNRNGCWAAYTLDESAKCIQLLDESPLLGTHMKT